jgi:hypothetical protein
MIGFCNGRFAKMYDLIKVFTASNRPPFASRQKVEVEHDLFNRYS